LTKSKKALTNLKKYGINKGELESGSPFSQENKDKALWARDVKDKKGISKNAKSL
jgi:hypothetical protein